MIDLFITQKDRRTRTFTHELGFSVTICAPTTSELNAALRSSRGDQDRFNVYVAKNWFVGFDGLRVDGEVPANTPESRAHLLESPLINEFIGAKLRDAALWVDEGNAEGAAAS